MTVCTVSAAKRVLAMVPLVALLTVRPAHAYIDPGTGSYVLQAVAATVLAGFFVPKTSWSHFRERIARLLHKKTPAGPADGS